MTKISKTEFTRLFLLNADILGVYNPLNGNHNEYDSYIDFTIYCFGNKYSAKGYVFELLDMIGSDDFRNKSEFVRQLYKASRKQFKEMYK